MKKLVFCFLLLLFLVACNATKHVAAGAHLLEQNYIFVDSVRDKSAALEKYILQKPNPKPIGLFFHNLGKHGGPDTPLEWGLKKPK